MSLDTVLTTAHQEFHAMFGFRIDDSTISVVDDATFERWSAAHGYDPAQNGIYFPDDLKAVVRDSAPPGVAIHEWLGHGSFFEKSRIGQAFRRSAEQVAFLEYVPDPAHEFGFSAPHSVTFEAWPAYVEKKVSDVIGIRRAMPVQEARLASLLTDMEQRSTKLGLIGQLGFPKHYTDEGAVEALFSLYPAFTRSPLVLLYGSREPYSDIDFLVEHGEGWETITTPWIDVYRLSSNDLEWTIALHDISVIDPLSTGKLVAGSSDRIERLHDFMRMPITQAMIDHNRKRAGEQGSLDFKNSEAYAKSYAGTANLLESGVKPRTKDEAIAGYEAPLAS